MAGQADCLNCKHAAEIEYKDVTIANPKLKQLKCKARSQVMYVFKDFYCWFYTPK